MRAPTQSTTYTTGNEVRDKMIAAVAQEHGAIQLADAQRLLPEGFDLDATEWNSVLASLAEPIADTTAAEPVEFEGDPAELKHSAEGGILAHQHKIVVPRANGTAQPHDDDAAKSTPRPVTKARNYTEAAAWLSQIQNRVAEHRAEVRVLASIAAEKRGKLAAAVSAWQAGGAAADPEALRMSVLRDHLAASRAERARRVESIPPELRNQYGPAAQFTRKQRQTPPGVPQDQLRKGSSRGAAPASMRVLPGAIK